MRKRTALALMAVSTLAVPVTAVAANAVEFKTAGAVRAADDAWGDAEAKGDAAFVDRLLMADYESVRPDGTVSNKAAIVDGARKHKNDPAFTQKVAEWKASHPSRAEVVIVGNTAVLTWVSVNSDKGAPVRSCDIFVYVDGHWRALYSQHSKLED